MCSMCLRAEQQQAILPIGNITCYLLATKPQLYLCWLALAHLSIYVFMPHAESACVYLSVYMYSQTITFAYMWQGVQLEQRTSQNF